MPEQTTKKPFRMAEALDYMVQNGATPQEAMDTAREHVRSNGLQVDTTGLSSWQARVAKRPNPSVPEHRKREQPRIVTTDSGPALSQQQTNRAFGSIMAHEVGPTALSVATTALVPEGRAVLGIAPWLLRPLVAYGAGFSGEGMAQGLSHEPINFSEMNSRGAREAFGQGIGELATGWMPGTAHDMYRDALKPSSKATQASMRTQSRITGGKVIPQQADLAAQGLRERMPIGSAFGSGTSAEHLAGLRSGPNENIRLSLAAADATPHRTTINDLLKQLGDLRKQLMKEQGGPRNIEVFDDWANELRRQWSEPAGPGVKSKRLTPSELDEQTRIWQKQAHDAYQGKPDPVTQLRARMNAALARAGRQRLEALPMPSAVNPGRTVGQDIAEANLRLSELKPLEQAALDAEIGITTGSNRGRLLPHWSKGGIEPPKFRPAHASRIALTMDNPAFRAGVRRAPNIGMAGASLLDQLLAPKPIVPSVAESDRPK